MAKRVSLKIAPGVRLSASSRGVRTSIGNSNARVSFGSGGTYTSARGPCDRLWSPVTGSGR